MTVAWETGNEDVATVLDAHQVRKSYGEIDKLLDDVIDHDAIERGLLHYTELEDQTDSMLSDIEDQLMTAGVIPKGDKKFNNPD